MTTTARISKTNVAHTTPCSVTLRMKESTEVTRDEALKGLADGTYKTCAVCDRSERSNATAQAVETAAPVAPEQVTDAVITEALAEIAAEDAGAEQPQATNLIALNGKGRVHKAGSAATPACGAETKGSQFVETVAAVNCKACLKATATASAVKGLSDRVDAAHAAAEAKRSPRKPASAKRPAKKVAQPQAAAVKATETDAPAQPQPPTGNTGSDVVALFAHAAHTGRMTKVRVSNMTRCFKRVMERSGTALDTDVLTLDLDAVISAYEAAVPVSEDNARSGLLADFRRAVALFTLYRQAPESWDPSVRTAPSAVKAPKRRSIDLPVAGGTLRVLLGGEMDPKEALEQALAGLTAEAPAPTA